MAEWWNLDQALIWIATGDLEQVDLAEGDAAGLRERKHCYFNLADLGTDKASCAAAEDGNDEDGSSSFELLMKLLRQGKIAAVRAGDETGTLLPSSVFNELQIGPNDAGLALIFRPPGTRWVAGIVREQEAALILLSRDDVLRWAPARAPDSLQDELAILVLRPSIKEQDAPEEPQRQLSPERQRAVEIVKEDYPSGIPRRRDGYGAQGKVIRAVKDRMLAEGWPKEKVRTLDETIRRAGGAKPG